MSVFGSIPPGAHENPKTVSAGAGEELIALLRCTILVVMALTVSPSSTRDWSHVGMHARPTEVSRNHEMLDIALQWSGPLVALPFPCRELTSAANACRNFKRTVTNHQQLTAVILDTPHLLSWY